MLLKSKKRISLRLPLSWFMFHHKLPLWVFFLVCLYSGLILILTGSPFAISRKGVTFEIKHFVAFIQLLRENFLSQEFWGKTEPDITLKNEHFISHCQLSSEELIKKGINGTHRVKTAFVWPEVLAFNYTRLERLFQRIEARFRSDCSSVGYRFFGKFVIWKF